MFPAIRSCCCIPCHGRHRRYTFASHRCYSVHYPGHGYQPLHRSANIHNAEIQIRSYGNKVYAAHSVFVQCHGIHRSDRPKPYPVPYGFPGGYGGIFCRDRRLALYQSLVSLRNDRCFLMASNCSVSMVMAAGITVSSSLTAYPDNRRVSSRSNSNSWLKRS